VWHGETGRWEMENASGPVVETYAIAIAHRTSQEEMQCWMPYHSHPAIYLSLFTELSWQDQNSGSGLGDGVGYWVLGFGFGLGSVAASWLLTMRVE